MIGKPIDLLIYANTVACFLQLIYVNPELCVKLKGLTQFLKSFFFMYLRVYLRILNDGPKFESEKSIYKVDTEVRKSVLCKQQSSLKF